MVGSFGTFGKFLTFKKKISFPFYNGGTKPVYAIRHHVFDKVIECTNDYLTNFGCKLLIATVIITILSA